MKTYFGFFKQFCNHYNYTGILLPYHFPKVINCIIQTALSDNVTTCFIVFSQGNWIKLKDYQLLLQVIIFNYLKNIIDNYFNHICIYIV